MPLLHIVNRDFDLDQTVGALGPYEDFEAHGESEPDTYARALAFEVEYALFESLKTNQDISRYLILNVRGTFTYPAFGCSEKCPAAGGRCDWPSGGCLQCPDGLYS